MSDESLELPEVHAAFREAERQFQDLAGAARDLQSLSSQLEDARSTLNDAGRRLADLADASSAVAGQLAEATRAIQATDPAEIQSRLREVMETLESDAQESAKLLTAVSNAQQTASEDHKRQARLQLIVTSITLLAVIAVGVLLFVI